ncbi:MAG: hypothetical protein AB2531_08080, partial [Candidatus Thiodiazotropha sp.]
MSFVLTKKQKDSLHGSFRNCPRMWSEKLSLVGFANLNIGTDSENTIFTQYAYRLILSVLHEGSAGSLCRSPDTDQFPAEFF